MKNEKEQIKEVPTFIIKLYYYGGRVPIRVDREKYLPEVYDGRCFYGFKTKK